MSSYLCLRVDTRTHARTHTHTHTIILVARNKTCDKNEYARWRISSKREEYSVFYNWKWCFQMELTLLTCDNQVLRVKGCFYQFLWVFTKIHQRLECPIPLQRYEPPLQLIICLCILCGTFWVLHCYICTPIVSRGQTAFFSFYMGAEKKGSGESPIVFLFCRSPDFGDLIAYYVTKLNGFQWRYSTVTIQKES